MIKILSKILDTIDSISIFMGKLSKYFILIIIGIMLIEIISRYLFNNPTEWVVEMSSYLFGASFFLGGGYVLLKEEHVRMDILYINWTDKLRKIADVITFPLLALYIGMIIYGGINNVKFSILSSEHSNSLWGPPLAPIKIVIVLGSAILLLQATSIFIRDIFSIFNKHLVKKN
jgi:TRAP-type mannitol/chloroaromatic compound transport system permease small subunit